MGMGLPFGRETDHSLLYPGTITFVRLPLLTRVHGVDHVGIFRQISLSIYNSLCFLFSKIRPFITSTYPANNHVCLRGEVRW